MDVRAALAMVNADSSILGIVYRTDATVSDHVRILYEIPEGEVPPIRYSVARIHRSDAPPEADQFFDFLFSDQARKIFSEHGFIPVLGAETAK
jgi:molybdate transport system substrate-binding protein